MFTDGLTSGCENFKCNMELCLNDVPKVANTLKLEVSFSHESNTLNSFKHHHKELC